MTASKLYEFGVPDSIFQDGKLWKKVTKWIAHSANYRGIYQPSLFQRRTPKYGNHAILRIRLPDDEAITFKLTFSEYFFYTNNLG